jgi:hypothetical protein
MKQELEKLRHARSTQDFPDIDLEPNEFIELSIKRSNLGLLMIWAGEAVGFIALTVILILLLTTSTPDLLMGAASLPFLLFLISVLYVALIITGLVGTFVYKRNHLIVTNQRVFQTITSSLFAHSTNIIDLKSVEDVSFKQAGLLDYILHMGTIRMSTVGDETTYTFPFIDTPRDELKAITHLVHVAKEKG